MTVAARERLVVEVAEIIENASLQLEPDGDSLIANSHSPATDAVRLMLGSGAPWRYWDGDAV
jgi:hypothetical protein